MYLGMFLNTLSLCKNVDLHDHVSHFCHKVIFDCLRHTLKRLRAHLITLSIITSSQTHLFG